MGQTQPKQEIYSATELQRSLLDLVQNIKLVIQGKDEIVLKMLAAWLSDGHVLIEDVPGTGKTLLAKALARSIDAKFQRVQFTPDLLPSDILGTNIYSTKSESFRFIEGPLFSNVLLADEINRATPRTQSALLEAMAENQCTIDGQTYSLPQKFFVIATQNPVEHQGTFPLPEAQLDRFCMQLSLGYPDPQTELKIANSQLQDPPLQKLRPVLSIPQWQQLTQLCKQIEVSANAAQYALQLVLGTRQDTRLRVGASPRATIALIRLAQGLAMLHGYRFVKPDYIKSIAKNALQHRVSLSTHAKLERYTTEKIISEIVDKTPVPLQ